MVLTSPALSPIQYKNTGDGHWYRIGEVNLPQRMTQILDLKPDFTEFISWVIRLPHFLLSSPLTNPT